MSHAFDLWRKTNFGQKLSVVSLVFLVLTLPLGVILALSPTHLLGRAQSTTTTTLYLLPSETTSAPNSTVEFTLGMTASQENTAAAEIHISFDKNFVEAQSVEILDFLPVRLEEPLINNDQGTVSFTLGNNLIAPRTGSGQFAKITFRTTSQTGQTVISFDRNMTKVATLGENGSAIPEVMNASLNIKP